MKSCIYCKSSLEDNSIIEVCQSCGHEVWGPKMFQAIIDNMENAKEVGDLYQGSVSDPIPAQFKVESEEEQSVESFDESNSFG
jgi:uncharacterized UBP type Zn finger protein